MSEDASVNIGAVEWPEVDSAYFAVRRMQIKLHRWAGEDLSRRFGDLFNLVYDPAFLVPAWERVSSNAGARTAGIDRVMVTYVESRVGVTVFLDQLRNSLKSGEFQPVEVRQTMIPKGRSGKLRKLGIPTVADRVVQAAVKAVLEPIFEADFLPCSYGFRPNRRAQDAIAEIHYLTSYPRDYGWVLEADIQGVFRRNRAHAIARSGAAQDHRQAPDSAGKGVLEIRDHDPDRRPGTNTDRNPTRGYSFPIAR
jgi:RNA-directed DNA polymerase